METKDLSEKLGIEKTPKEQFKDYFHEKITSLKNHYHKKGFFNMLSNFPKELIDDFYETSGW